MLSQSGGNWQSVSRYHCTCQSSENISGKVWAAAIAHVRTSGCCHKWRQLTGKVWAVVITHVRTPVARCDRCHCVHQNKRMLPLTLMGATGKVWAVVIVHVRTQLATCEPRMLPQVEASLSLSLSLSSLSLSLSHTHTHTHTHTRVCVCGSGAVADLFSLQLF